MALRVFVWVWVPGLAYGLLASGELEVEAAAFEHDQSDCVLSNFCGPFRRFF